MFQGFTQETVDFMWGIRFNNERGWFLEHKEDYQKHLLEPVKALGEDIYKGVQEMLLPVSSSPVVTNFAHAVLLTSSPPRTPS